ncbi:hypothetical protein HPB47_013617 [Ixodes persulcatus]|uniref:Uncharacterized protein n=1 Tax=Ixodes persulcatus TaxID=34615 RepID=A0AC60R1P2_IXOPE|nr:hypothetical protein HPB47_013617 [Ixodes persulcatus]
MTVFGPDAQNVFRTLPLSEDDKNLDIVKQRFKEHFHPKVNHAYEQYRFNQKKADRSLQAKKCRFGELTDEVLRDRIIVGITNNDVRERLLSDPTVDLQKAVNLCKASESFRRHTLEILQMTRLRLDNLTALMATVLEALNEHNKNDDDNCPVQEPHASYDSFMEFECNYRLAKL